MLERSSIRSFVAVVAAAATAFMIGWTGAA
jgi:hypothetical protein